MRGSLAALFGVGFLLGCSSGGAGSPVGEVEPDPSPSEGGVSGEAGAGSAAKGEGGAGAVQEPLPVESTGGTSSNPESNPEPAPPSGETMDGVAGSSAMPSEAPQPALNDLEDAGVLDEPEPLASNDAGAPDEAEVEVDASTPLDPPTSETDLPSGWTNVEGSPADWLWFPEFSEPLFGDAAVGLDGDFIVVGSSDEEIERPVAGPRDAFVAKYSPEAEVRWIRQIGGDGLDYASHVGVDAMGNIVVGLGLQVEPEAPTDLKLMKLSSDGEELWTRDLVDERDWSNSLFAVGPAGESVAVLYTKEAFVYSAEGDLLGSAKLDSQPGMTYYDVVLDSSGELFICGGRYVAESDILAEQYVTWLGGYSPELELAWESEDRAGRYRSVAVDESANITVAGTDYNTLSSAWLTRYDSEGTSVWTRSLESTGGLRHPYDLAAGPDGNLVLLRGISSGDPSYPGDAMFAWDAYLWVGNQDGEPLWGKRLAGDDYIDGFYTSVSPEGDVFVVGHGLEGAFVARVADVAALDEVALK